MENFDCIIVGAGIVGLATAYKLVSIRPELKVCVLDKENRVGRHQTGNNSGVIHSGIYYRPGSAKALNCKKGYNELITFAEEHGIDYELCGKIIVASDESEINSLNKIYERGLANGLENLQLLGSNEIKEREPHVSGKKAIWVPQAGIIDYGEVANTYRIQFENKGGTVKLSHKVIGISELSGKVYVETDKCELEAKTLINCAGLHSDRIAKMVATGIGYKVLPFRGEFYKLKEEKRTMVNGLIYPVPNPKFPFLGVHFTKTIHGGVEAGPNAVLAMKREGYRKTDINLRDFMETLFYPGFQKIAMRYWQEGLAEQYRSWSKKAFVKSLQKLVPEVRIEDLEKGHSGVRAQACTTSGELIDDFHFVQSGSILNVCNSPSPAATASLSIGESIVGRIQSLI